MYIELLYVVLPTQICFLWLYYLVTLFEMNFKPWLYGYD